MGNDLNFPTIFWACNYQSMPKLAFQLKNKQLQVQNWQKNQIVTCETCKMHLLQTFVFSTLNFDDSPFLSQLT